MEALEVIYSNCEQYKDKHYDDSLLEKPRVSSKKIIKILADLAIGALFTAEEHRILAAARRIAVPILQYPEQNNLARKVR
jgi:hypothetical protein